jgi:hypothetical protein
LSRTGIEWWVHGGVALALRGLEVDPGDVDLAVGDAARRGEVFANVLVEPVTHFEGRSAG